MANLPITQAKELTGTRKFLIYTCGVHSVVALVFIAASLRTFVFPSVALVLSLIWLAMALAHLVGWAIVVWRIEKVRAIFEKAKLLWIFDVEWYLPGYLTYTVITIISLLFHLLW